MPHYPYQLILEGEKSGYTLGDSKVITLSSQDLESARDEAQELLWGDPDDWKTRVWGPGSVTVDLDPDGALEPTPLLSRGQPKVLSAHIVLFAGRIDIDSMKEEIASRSDTINKADKDKAERQLYLKLKEKWEDHEDEK